MADECTLFPSDTLYPDNNLLPCVGLGITKILKLVSRVVRVVGLESQFLEEI
jgi:hypothetical protein